MHVRSSRLSSTVPAELEAERDLALSLAMLARIRMEDGRAAQAADAVERQFVIFERLHAVDGANLSAKRDLALAHERQGSLHAATGSGRRLSPATTVASSSARR